MKKKPLTLINLAKLSRARRCATPDHPAPLLPPSEPATGFPPSTEYEALGNGGFRRRALPPADEQVIDELPDEAA